MAKNSLPPATTPTKTRAPRQAEIFAQFSHLERQRQACRLAERILRVVAGADLQLAETAVQIAVTAVREKVCPQWADKNSGAPVSVPEPQRDTRDGVLR
jgi:hypothetical protein